MKNNSQKHKSEFKNQNVLKLLNKLRLKEKHFLPPKNSQKTPMKRNTKVRFKKKLQPQQMLLHFLIIYLTIFKISHECRIIFHIFDTEISIHFWCN